MIKLPWSSNGSASHFARGPAPSCKLELDPSRTSTRCLHPSPSPTTPRGWRGCSAAKKSSPGLTSTKLALTAAVGSREDSGDKTSENPAFNSHCIVKGKTATRRKKHWKCKCRCMVVKSSHWALCWVHGGIQWPWGSLTCWMSQEYALQSVRQCHVIWLQQ